MPIMIDVLGKTFGKITVISRAETPLNRVGAFWNCDCTCGNSKVISGSDLNTGRVMSCGCLRSFGDITGKVFGRLTVLSIVGMGTNNRQVVKCQCSCGTIKNIPRNALVTGNTISCGCASMERIRKIATDRREHSDGMANARTLYARYKVSARNRDYEFLLLFDEFYKLTQMDCVYCGDKPNSILAQKNTVGSITYNGIDRRDNTLGYTLENCYPCCSRCNKAKLTMTHDQFLDMCRTIVRKWD